MLLPIIFAVAATVGALLYLARPFFGQAQLSPAPADGLAARRLELAEERDRALAALKELEFDHRTGKVSDGDYRELIGALRRRAVETLRVLDPPGPPLRTDRSRRERRLRSKALR
jgi:hypothetical protein